MLTAYSKGSTRDYHIRFNTYDIKRATSALPVPSIAPAPSAVSPVASMGFPFAFRLVVTVADHAADLQPIPSSFFAPPLLLIRFSSNFVY